MAQTVSNLTDVLKEAWTSDALEKQFYDKNPFLERVEKMQATMIGENALVPIHKDRNGGYTSTGAAGGSLNAAGNQQVDQASYTLVYHWHQIKIETGALNQTGSASQSVVVAKDLEVKGAVADMRRQATRQVVTNGDGVLAACATDGSADTTIDLAVDSATAYGYQALVRGWLHVGLQVDIGDISSNSDSVAAGATISAVSVDSATPTFTQENSVTTTAGTDYVTIANPNSGTAVNTEMNGLRNIVNTTGALGGLNPASAGEEFWAAADRDTTTTVLSLDLILDLQRQVMQKTGQFPGYVLTSLKQQQNFYSLLQNQVRFQGDMKLGAGNVGGVIWNNQEINAIPDVLDQDWFALTLDDLAIITGSIKKPTWASDLEGSGGRLRWAQGATNFVDAVVYPINLICKRRNSHAAATGLTA